MKLVRTLLQTDYRLKEQLKILVERKEDQEREKRLVFVLYVLLL